MFSEDAALISNDQVCKEYMDTSRFAKNTSLIVLSPRFRPYNGLF